MKKIYTFCKNLLPVAALLLCCMFMPQLRAQTYVGTWSELLTELAKPSVTEITLTDAITVPAGTYTLNSAAGGTTIYPATGKRHFLIPSGTVDLTFDNVVLDGSWDGVSDNYLRGGIEITGTGTEVTLTAAIVQNCSNSHNNYNGYGGGIYNEGGILTLQNCTISHNHASSGAGVCVYLGELTMNSGTISHNTNYIDDGINHVYEINSYYGGDGGGVSIRGSKFTMNSGSISENRSTQGSGVVVENNSEFTMNGGEISYNIANIFNMGNAGTVSIDDGSKLIMNGGKISYNEGNENGGGMRLYGTLEMWGGEISYNKALFGGGIQAHGTIIMHGGKISDNIAIMGGGVLICQDGHFIMDGNSEISGNKAVIGGGVWTLEAPSEFEMFGGEISNNIAGDMGLATDVSNILEELISGYRENPDNNIIKDLNANDFFDLIVNLYSEIYNLSIGGGGVYLVPENTFTMTGGKIINNSALNGDGGGIFAMDHTNVTITPGTIFSGNTAKEACRLESVPNDSVYNPGVPITAAALKALTLVPNNVNNPNTITLSAPPSGAPFLYAYNNYDINYIYNESTEEQEIPVTQVCPKDSISLVVNVVNNWDNPFYQWILNGEEVAGANDTVFKYKPKDIDTVQCKVFAYEDCADEVYSQIMVIELLPKPTLNQPQNIEVCAGETIGGVTFEGSNFDEVQWVMSGTAVGLPASSGTGNISSFTAANNSSTGASVATITATPISGSCEGESKTFTITVNPKVKLSAKIRIR